MKVETTRIALSLLLFLTCLASPEPALAADPVRLAVETDRLEVAPGDTVELTVELRDAKDQPATAPRELSIHLVLVQDDEEIGTANVTIAQGESSARHEIEAKKPGLVEVRAEHPELHNGGAFFHVKAGAGMTFRSATLAQPMARPEPSPPSPSPSPPTVAAPVPAEPDTTETVAEIVADETEPVSPETRPRLILRSTPRRGLLADGKDPATIYAFLQGGDPSGYSIRLVPDAGRLDPLPLRIPRGQSSATAVLTASRPGRVKVEYVSAEPELGPVDPELLEVEFEPPITSLHVAAQPSPLRVGETGEVVAHLVDASGTPVKTAKERQVKFDVTTGRVRLGAHSVTVPAGEFEARTTVTGEWWGDAEVSASSPNLLTRFASLPIEFPWELLAVTMVGSLAGGFIAWTYGKAKHRWLWQRLFTGLVAGLVLYWLLLLTGIVPSVALANPLGVFAVAVLGGWLGTEVFDLAVERLGLRTAQQPA